MFIVPGERAGGWRRRPVRAAAAAHRAAPFSRVWIVVAAALLAAGALGWFASFRPWEINTARQQLTALAGLSVAIVEDSDVRRVTYARTNSHAGSD